MSKSNHNPKESNMNLNSKPRPQLYTANYLRTFSDDGLENLLNEVWQTPEFNRDGDPAFRALAARIEAEQAEREARA